MGTSLGREIKQGFVQGCNILAEKVLVSHIQAAAVPAVWLMHFWISGEFSSIHPHGKYVVVEVIKLIYDKIKIAKQHDSLEG